VFKQKVSLALLIKYFNRDEAVTIHSNFVWKELCGPRGHGAPLWLNEHKQPRVGKNQNRIGNVEQSQQDGKAINSASLIIIVKTAIKKTKLHGLSPRANYTDRATAACWRSDYQLLRIKGATWSA
jgi:hypothetical protein